MESRFETFTAQERSLVGLGLSLLTMDMFLGIAGGPFEPETQARDFPALVKLIDEVGASFDVSGLNRDLVGKAIAILDQRAAAAKEGT